MLKPILFAALSLVMPPQLAQAADEAPILTISGETVAPNRAPQSAGQADMFGFHEISFDRGHALTRSDLLGLPAYRILKPLETDGEVAATVMQSYSGPRVVDVLKLAQAQGQTLRVQGLDGYAAEIPFDDLLDYGAILAIELDGRPLGIGGKGPTMVVFEPVAEEETAQRLSDAQVWGVFYIDVH